MILLRRLFGILLIAVAIVLVFSIIVTFSSLVAYFALLYTCLTEPCDGEKFKDIFFGIITYLFMGAMIYYLGRRGLSMLISIKPEEPEPSAILDDTEYRERIKKTGE